LVLKPEGELVPAMDKIDLSVRSKTRPSLHSVISFP